VIINILDHAMSDCDDRHCLVLCQIVSALRQTFLWPYNSLQGTEWDVTFLHNGYTQDYHTVRISEICPCFAVLRFRNY